MPIDSGGTPPDPTERRRQIHDVVSKCLADWTPLSASELSRRFPQLLPELEVEMAKLRQIMAGPVHAADKDSIHMNTTGLLSVAGGEPRGLVGTVRLVCRQCAGEWECPADHGYPTIDCPYCGHRELLEVGDRPIDQLTCWGRREHFELLGRLGLGMFSTVWLARDTRLERLVAIKIPRRDELDDSYRRLAAREARIAAQLQHPGIVPIYDLIEEPTGISLVTAYIPGVTLSVWQKKRSHTVAEIATVGADIAAALDYAHRAGVVHRDLKPANILIDPEGRPHIADFGLAKYASQASTISLTGRPLGTPAYMSPEQARGEGAATDGRSDIYSLGVILFEWISGILPFSGDSLDVIRAIQHDAPPPLTGRDRHLSVPRRLERAVRRCMHKCARDRFATAAELAEVLHAVACRPQRSWRDWFGR